MEKSQKFFITTLVLGLVSFSSVHVIPTQVTQALITENQIADNAITSPKIKDGEVKTQDLANGAVTKDKISPFALKLVTVERHAIFDVPAHSNAGTVVKCNRNEVVTGGGFIINEPDKPIVTWQSKALISSNGWSVAGRNTDDASHSIIGSVVCAHLELGP
jgi:hypothetical protein